MKKKLLFFGFLIAVFAAMLSLQTFAFELPSEDAGCIYCRPTWENVEQYHCGGSKCVCTFEVCPTCGDKTVLVYCGQLHQFVFIDGYYVDHGSTHTFTCYYCDDGTFFIGNNNFHTHTGHKYGSETIVEPTCLTRGYTTMKCSVSSQCALYDKTTRLSTSYTAATLNHTYVFVETLTGSCGSYSGDLYQCSGCGFQKLENAVANPHTPTDAGTVTPATCTTAGYTTHTCSTCSVTYTVDEVPATGHSYTSEITTPATCSSTGVKTYSCSNCSDSYTETIPKTDHSYQSVVTAPTCTAAGYTTFTCTVCQDTYTGNNTAAKGHKNTTKVTTAATCTTAGSQTTTCSVCGYSTTASIAATGHSYKSNTVVPDCTEGGYTVYTCSTCGDSYTGDQIAAAGHKYLDVVTEPTCTKGGYTKHTCSVCQDTYTDAVTSALGHNYKSLVTAPTCTVRGYTDHVCANCGDNYRDTFVAALGHTEERYGLDWKCTVCGRIRVETTGIRAVGSILDGFRIFGVGFASGAVELFDDMIMDGDELTTVASAAFALIGLALAVVIAFIVFRKFTKRQ